MRELRPGDQIRVQSRSGGTHEVTVVYGKVDHTSLFVRMANGKLGRLSPYRVDWRTLERVGTGEFAAPGDEVIVVGLDGVERRGKLVAPIGERLELTPPDGHKFTVTLDEVDLRAFRLLFPTTRLRDGDEFLVRSRSGNEYRGLALEVGEHSISALLRPSRQKTRLKVAALDMDSLYVLIPVYGASEPPSWTGDESTIA